MNGRYKEYLKSGEWKYIRDKKIKQVDYTCEGCGEQYKPLDVHHKIYERIGDEMLTDLIALCPICHKKIHKLTELSDWHKYIKHQTNEAPPIISKEDVELRALIDSI